MLSLLSPFCLVCFVGLLCPLSFLCPLYPCVYFKPSVSTVPSVLTKPFESTLCVYWTLFPLSLLCLLSLLSFLCPLILLCSLRLLCPVNTDSAEPFLSSDPFCPLIPLSPMCLLYPLRFLPSCPLNITFHLSLLCLLWYQCPLSILFHLSILCSLCHLYTEPSIFVLPSVFPGILCPLCLSVQLALILCPHSLLCILSNFTLCVHWALILSSLSIGPLRIVSTVPSVSTKPTTCMSAEHSVSTCFHCAVHLCSLSLLQ